jgi:hypothetical protein
MVGHAPVHLMLGCAGAAFCYRYIEIVMRKEKFGAHSVEVSLFQVLISAGG